MEFNKEDFNKNYITENLNENIQIKIGDKTFGGSIKSLKTIKTQK